MHPIVATADLILAMLLLDISNYLVVHAYVKHDIVSQTP